MLHFQNEYKEGVGHTVLELFKKLLQVKKEHASTVVSELPAQTGGTRPVEVAEVVKVETDGVKLTKVEQYYDGTIYEGVINDGNEFYISFNIKDRTKGSFQPQEQNNP
jgi:hypothetical protein